MDGGVRFADRVRGCLLGGAIGDALGAPIEFVSSGEIARTFGSSGLRAYLPVTFDGDHGVGLVTDDTQMTLFTVEGIIRADIRWRSKGICHPPAVIHHAYLRWLTTQEVPGPPPSAQRHDVDGVDGWLGRESWLYSRRAPGLTCISELSASRSGGFGWVAVNDSKGCGTVMRSAPFGLARAHDPGAIAMECAAITHGHITGQVAAGAFAVLIDAIVAGHSLTESIDVMMAWLGGVDGADETIRAISQAITCGATSPRTQEVVESLGGGWVAEEALAIGVFAALAYPEPEQVLDALALAVTHGGDADSTGSICGNILGALHGTEALPAELLEPLEGRATITQLSDDFVAIATNAAGIMASAVRAPGVITIPVVSESWLDRYPGW